MLTFRTAHQNTTIFMVFRRKVLMNLQAHRAGHMQKVISSFWRWKSTSLTILRKQHEIVLTSDNQYTQNINCRHWIKYSILHHKMTPHLDVIQIKTNWPPFIHTHVLVSTEKKLFCLCTSSTAGSGWWHFTSIPTNVNIIMAMVMMSSHEKPEENQYNNYNCLLQCGLNGENIHNFPF